MDNTIRTALLDQTNIKHLSKLADLSALKNKLIASNVANVETPGYQRKTFDFDRTLRKSMEEPKLSGVETHPKHIPLGDDQDRPPKIIHVKHSENSTGINSVDIDQEMSEMSQNQLIYQFGSKMLSRKFNGLTSAIRGE